MQQEHANMPHLDTLGLDFNPFPVVPDAHNYFTTEGMNTAISDILHCIEARKGFILISGEVGLGKTTLSRLLLLKLAVNKVNTSLVLNTFLQSGSLLKAINKDFNIHIESNLIEDQLEALNNFLLDQYAQDRNCVIVIDDAQQLNLESLELVRQLSNLETNQNKLLQIILVAQGEILTTLSRQDMRQLKSRIALNIKIEPLTINELKQYIQFRLARAGSSGQIDLESNAYKHLHKVTQGLPRQINLVMDRCLYVVAAYGINKIDKSLIKKAYQEICIDTFNEKKPASNKWLPIAAIFIAGLGFVVFQFKDLLFAGFIESDITQNTTIKKDQFRKIDQNLITSGKKTENKLVSLANVKQPFQLEKKATVVVENKPNKTVKTFLEQFNLEDLERVFVSSLEKNDFTDLNINLSQVSTYKVLISDNEIQSDNQSYVWEFKDNNNNPKWLTFWKPQFVLNAFYQGYYSENILLLQSILKDEGFYLARIDGIVGEKTIFAISKLQSTLGINPSGFPDEITLYQLQKIGQKGTGTGSSENYLEIYKKNIKTPTRNNTDRYAVDNSTVTD